MNRKYILSLVVLAAAIGAVVFFVCKRSSPAGTVTATAGGQVAPTRDAGAPTLPSAIQVDVGAAIAPASDAGVRTAPAGYKGEGWHVSSSPSPEAVIAAVHTDAVLMLDAKQRQASGTIPAAAVLPSSSSGATLNTKGSTLTH